MTLVGFTALSVEISTIASAPTERAASATWRVPTLLLWAGDDHYVDPAGSEAFLAAAPPDVVTGQCFPALYHELFNETDRDAVLDVVSRWLRERP